MTVVAMPMQNQTPRTTLPRKKIIPLKGVESFSALMRTRPVAAWDQCMVHVLTKVDAHSQPQASIELGLIVPKKAYVLAVDRNRIRRVLRAQCLERSHTLPCSVQVLFRIKANAKKGKQNKDPIHSELFNNNPHSAQFAAAIKQGLDKALLAFKTAPLVTTP
jgi:ribonuclease P protein component